MPPQPKLPFDDKSTKADYVKSQGQDRAHHCHWPSCQKQCPPAMWGCYKHWMMLPKYLRDKVWAAYRPGQEKDMRPSREYLDVAQEVQDWIVLHYPENCKACGGTGVSSSGNACVPCVKAGRI